MVRATGPIDAHAHVLIPDADALVAGQDGLARARADDLIRTGERSSAALQAMVRSRIPQLTELAPRLADMEAAGIAVQVLSPSPSHYHYWADADLGAAVAERVNRAMAEWVARSPDRFVGLGTLPLQHPSLAVEVLTRAVTDHGLIGVQIGTHAPGVELSSPALDPLWRRAEELGAIVFLHPLSCPMSDRLAPWYLSNLIGNPIEHAVALSHLIFSGVLDRFPRLQLLAAHGGGALPGIIGRADHGWHVREDARGCAEPPSSYLRRIWFDSLVFEPDALTALVRTVGADRVVLGTDYPFDMGVDDPVERVREAGLPDADARAITVDNALRLLAGDRTPGASA